MKIKTEQTIHYMDFPQDLQKILIRDYIERGSQNGSFTYIEVYKEEGEENPVVDFLLENGAELKTDIMLKLSW